MQLNQQIVSRRVPGDAPLRPGTFNPFGLLGLNLLALTLLVAGATGCGPASTPGSAPQSPIQAPRQPVSSGDSFEHLLAAGRAGQLERLELSHPLAAPQQLAELSEQDAWLGELILDEGVVDDAQVPWIARLPELWHLRLRHSPITDDGFAELARCDSLQILNLPQCRATAAGVATLGRLPHLRSLRLGGETLGGDVADAIAGLKTLRSLHLIGVPIDDRGLRRIASLPKLQSLYLDDAAVSEQGWDWLFAEKSGLHVHVNQRHLDRDPGGHAHPTAADAPAKLAPAIPAPAIPTQAIPATDSQPTSIEPTTNERAE